MNRKEIEARKEEIRQTLAAMPRWMFSDPRVERLEDELYNLEGMVTSEDEERWMAPKVEKTKED